MHFIMTILLLHFIRISGIPRTRGVYVKTDYTCVTASSIPNTNDLPRQKKSVQQAFHLLRFKKQKFNIT